MVTYICTYNKLFNNNIFRFAIDKHNIYLFELYSVGNIVTVRITL